MTTAKMEYGRIQDGFTILERAVMNKDIFIDVTNIFLGILAIFWFGVAMLPYLHPVLP